MVVILISGKQGSGKSTLAKNLVQKDWGQSTPIHVLKFADPLYEMHDAVRGVLKKYDFTNYDFNKKDGNLLQLLGTEWGRNTINTQVWVQLLLNKIRKLEKNSVVIVDDARFENEFDSFMTVPHCLRVRIEASRLTRKLRASFWRENESHPSEVGLDHYAAMGKFDLVINADTNGPEVIASKVYLAAMTIKKASENEN